MSATGGRSLDYDVAELYKWIDRYPLTRQKRNISRDFSDAIPLAEILKHHYPKLVDMHNYSAKNSVSLKLANWQTLNKKVLSKLNVVLPNSVMEQLARSMPGAIEKVLFDIKGRIDNKDKDTPPEKPTDDVYLVEGLSTAVSGSIISIKQKDGKKALDHKVLPIEDLKRMETQLAEKDEAISILNNKVHHMENLLAIKEERITDLTKQLQQISEKSSKTSAKQNTKFLNKIWVN